MDSGLAYLLIGHQEIKLVLPIRQVLLGKMPPAFIESLPICCRAELESQACGATSTAFSYRCQVAGYPACCLTDSGLQADALHSAAVRTSKSVDFWSALSWSHSPSELWV
jgi:hypothetical protein